MSLVKYYVALLALLALYQSVGAQPTSLEPVLPPIPDPPYPHKVRFCGIADGAVLSLNSSITGQCDWKRYTMVRVHGHTKTDRLTGRH